MWQDNTNPYGASSSHSQYYAQSTPIQAPSPGAPLQFYSPSVSDSFYPGSRPSLDGNVGAQGSISQQGGTPPGYGGNMQTTGGWWTAFGTGGIEGEPPLLEGTRKSSCCVLIPFLMNFMCRTGNKLFAHTRKIIDGAEPTTSSRRTYHGRCRPCRPYPILLVFRHVSTFGMSSMLSCCRLLDELLCSLENLNSGTFMDSASLALRPSTYCSTSCRNNT